VEALNQSVRIPNLFKQGELLGASTLIKRLWPTAHLASAEVHPGADGTGLFKSRDFAMPDTRSIAESHPDQDTDQTRDVSAAPDDASGPKYFAVLALDGDEMGRWVSGTHASMPKLRDQLSPGALDYFQACLPTRLDRKRPLNPSFHLQFSEMLANFSNFCVRRIVEAHHGWLIYAGGDDVLALLPADTALTCARALRAGFRGEPDTLNGLVGACRGRDKEQPVRLFQVEQPGFVRLHSDAPKLEGEPGRFHAMVPGPAADCSVGIAIAHFKAPLQDVVRAAQAAEKRAKHSPKSGGLGRSALAVSLFKHSGEIIQWGCRWESGGLEAFARMASELAGGTVSAKFPHKIVELVEPYRTDDPDRLGGTRSAEGFDEVVDAILAREIETSADRQRGPNYTPAKAQALRNKILAYLKSPSLPDANRKTHALIGLCQTVAFVHRTARD
jgi:hypothetical protein